MTRPESCVLSQGAFGFIYFSWGNLIPSISKTGPERGGGPPKFTQSVRTEATMDFQTIPN